MLQGLEVRLCITAAKWEVKTRKCWIAGGVESLLPLYVNLPDTGISHTIGCVLTVPLLPFLLTRRVVVLCLIFGKTMKQTHNVKGQFHI